MFITCRNKYSFSKCLYTEKYCIQYKQIIDNRIQFSCNHHSSYHPQYIYKHCEYIKIICKTISIILNFRNHLTCENHSSKQQSKPYKLWFHVSRVWPIWRLSLLYSTTISRNFFVNFTPSLPSLSVKFFILDTFCHWIILRRGYC